MKVMTIVGTRPELIKMSRVIATFDKYTEHILVHTGQNYDYELNQIFFDELEISNPKYYLGCADSNPIKSIGNILVKVDEVIEKEHPDAVLIYGDTNSCLSAISAKKRKIPIFHMEAGNRCFDQRVPEEINRKIIDHLSDINLVLTEHARRNLEKEGLDSKTIFKTGSHLFEVLNYYGNKIKLSSILSKLKLTKDQYFLASFHREENVDSELNLKTILSILEQLQSNFNVPIIISTHPRTAKRLSDLGASEKNPKMIFVKPFGFIDYICLQKNSLCVLSDSGTLAEEATILNFPAVMLRNMHERPEAVDSGNFILGGLNPDKVLDAVKILIQQKKTGANASQNLDYEVINVSNKVLKIVLGYTDYINRLIWHKDK